MIYKEDNQMYYFIPVVFDTNCPASTEEMRRISYSPRGAGRISTSFESFKEEMEALGWEVAEVERFGKNSIPLGNTLEVVEGATGNY